MPMALKHQAVRTERHEGPPPIVAQSGSCASDEQIPRCSDLSSPTSSCAMSFLDGDRRLHSSYVSAGEDGVDRRNFPTHQDTTHEGYLVRARYPPEGVPPTLGYSEQCAQAAAFKRRQQQHHTHICGSAALSDAGSTSVGASGRVNDGHIYHAGHMSSRVPHWKSSKGLAAEQESKMENFESGAKLLGLPLKLPLHFSKNSPGAIADPNGVDGASEASCTSRCLSDFGSFSGYESISGLSCASQALSSKVGNCGRTDCSENSQMYSSSSSTIGAHSVGNPSVAFRPREDRRSSRTKKLEALQSSGSVLPVTNGLSFCVQKPLEVENKPLYPLSKMGADRLPRNTSTDPNILPGDAQWFDSVSSRRGTDRSCFCAGPCTVTPRSRKGCALPCEREDPYCSGESVQSSACSSARERQLAQSRSHIFGCTKVLDSPPVEVSRAKAEAAKELEVRRERRLLNPRYSDLFGRATPSPVEVSATSAGSRKVKDGKKGAKAQEDLSAHQRFHQAMQSHIGIGSSSTPSIDSAKRLPADTHFAVQQRKALTALTGSGEAFRFHQQSRVFGEPTDGTLRNALPRSTVVLGLSALRPDTQEDDIRKIVAKATNDAYAATRCACTVLLHSDPITNECKGTGTVSLRHTGEEHAVSELISLFSKHGIFAQIQGQK